MLKALVLCGGVGDRFQPLNADRSLVGFPGEVEGAAGGRTC